MKKNLFILSCECMFLFLSTFMSNEVIKDEKIISNIENVSSLVKVKQKYFSYQVPKVKEITTTDKFLLKDQNQPVMLNDENNNRVEESMIIEIKNETGNNQYVNEEKELIVETNEVNLRDTNEENKEIQKEDEKQLEKESNDYEKYNEKLINDLVVLEASVKDANNLEESGEEGNGESLIKEGYYSPNGTYLGSSKVKVIDVSHHQGKINWDDFVKYSDCYGVILRIGYYKTLDKQFENNINEIKRLNIPYGIYLFSYASSINGAITEMNFTNNVIDKYNLNPTLGIYYDIESWSTKTSSSDNISKSLYDNIINTYVQGVSKHVDNKYKVKLYSGRWYAMNRLGDVSKSYVDWVAEYNNTCKYDDVYSMWQYTSKGNVPGITGNVDISYLY